MVVVVFWVLLCCWGGKRRGVGEGERRKNDVLGITTRPAEILPARVLFTAGAAGLGLNVMGQRKRFRCQMGSGLPS